MEWIGVTTHGNFNVIHIMHQFWQIVEDSKLPCTMEGLEKQCPVLLVILFSLPS